MKHIKLNLNLILFILTIVIISIAKAKGTNNTRLKSPTPCIAGTDSWKGDFKRISTGVDVGSRLNDRFDNSKENTVETNCPGEDYYCAKNLVLVPVGQTFNCTTGMNEFCCAKIIIPASPCGTIISAPPKDFRFHPIKVQIICKSMEDLPNQ